LGRGARGVMKWFGKPKPSEVWDEPVDGPIGDIEAAERVRIICRSAADSAELAAHLANNGKRSAQKKQKVESDRYERAAKAAMAIAMKISDDLLRDSSVRQIVDLCMKAEDMRTARILFRAIQAASIREEVMKDYPALSQ